jgi:hypothetical protein
VLRSRDLARVLGNFVGDRRNGGSLGLAIGNAHRVQKTALKEVKEAGAAQSELERDLRVHQQTDWPPLHSQSDERWVRQAQQVRNGDFRVGERHERV